METDETKRENCRLMRIIGTHYTQREKWRLMEINGNS